MGIQVGVPRGSGTVADVVPAEALAFLSVRVGNPLTEPIRDRMAAAVHLQSTESLSGATDLTYILFGGPSAAEPIGALLVRGLDTVELSASPDLGVKPLGPKTLLITGSVHLGRLNALSGRTWGRERTFRELLRGMPARPPALVAAREPFLASFLQPYAPYPVSFRSELLMAVVPDGDGKTAGVLVHLQPAGGRVLVAPAAGATNAELLAKLPASTLLLLQRPRDLLALVLAPNIPDLPPSLRTAFQGIQQRADAVRPLLEMVEGPVFLGVLPTAAAGVRDTVLLIPLKDGAEPQPLLRTLESAFAGFGPYLGAGPALAPEFTETLYQGVPLRYLNFGSPARAIDYAVADRLLLFATSRESAQSVLDTIRAGASSLAASPRFAPIVGAAEGEGWTFFRFDRVLEAEIPEGTRPFHTLVGGLLLRPTGENKLTGPLLVGEEAPPTPSPTPPPPEPSPSPTDEPVPAA